MTIVWPAMVSVRQMATTMSALPFLWAALSPARWARAFLVLLGSSGGAGDVSGRGRARQRGSRARSCAGSRRRAARTRAPFPTAGRFSPVCGPDLHVDLRVGEDVAVPAGVFRCAAFRGDHENSRDPLSRRTASVRRKACALTPYACCVFAYRRSHQASLGCLRIPNPKNKSPISSGPDTLAPSRASLVQAAASLRQIRPVSASRFRLGQRCIGKVAEGVAIRAARICRGLDHLDRD